MSHCLQLKRPRNSSRASTESARILSQPHLISIPHTHTPSKCINCVMQEPFEALKMLLVCNKLSMQVCKYSMPGWPGPGVCMCHVSHYSFDDDLFLQGESKKSVISKNNCFHSISAPYCALLGLTGTYWALLGLTGPYWTLLGVTGPYWTLLSLTGPYWALFCICALTNWLTHWLTN